MPRARPHASAELSPTGQLAATTEAVLRNVAAMG